jgi:hypothetical protein
MAMLDLLHRSGSLAKDLLEDVRMTRSLRLHFNHSFALYYIIYLCL